MPELEKARRVLAFQMGIAAALAGQERSSNPYAGGGSRHTALVLPDSLAADWDRGFCSGLEQKRGRSDEQS